jgi:hypothetical protein
VSGPGFYRVQHGPKRIFRQLINQNDLFIDTEPNRWKGRFVPEPGFGAFSRTEPELMSPRQSRREGRTSPGKAALAPKQVRDWSVRSRQGRIFRLLLGRVFVATSMDQGRGPIAAK